MDNLEPTGYRVKDLAADLSRRMADQPIHVITIDGWSGSGKTTLAKKLADHLHLPRYDLDDYLHQNRGGFLEHLDYPRLATALPNVRATPAPVLIAGICALEVLQRLNLRSDLEVYVRRLLRNGIWYDGLRLDFETEEEAVEEVRSSAAKCGEAGEPLSCEVIRYHYRHLPHENADLHFDRMI